MPSPFPGMDPFLETNPLFQELHTQMLAQMQALLQPQLRPKYVARLERQLDLGACFAAAYDRIAADDEVDYRAEPPPPPLGKSATMWMNQLLRAAGLRKQRRRGGQHR
jgi:Protein of unknown function (DUF4058)